MTAQAGAPLAWRHIDWAKAQHHVYRLQMRIAKATKQVLHSQCLACSESVRIHDSATDRIQQKIIKNLQLADLACSRDADLWFCPR